MNNTAVPVQQVMDFAPVIHINLPETLDRQRIIRKGAEGRYNEALDYLRLELGSGNYESINSADFARTFKVTSSFLSLVAAIGGVSCIREKGKSGLCYQTTEKLANLKGKDLLDFRITEFPNPPYEGELPPVVPQQLLDKSPEQRQEFVQAMNNINAVLSQDIVQPEPKAVLLPHEIHGEKPIYLVGSIATDSVFEAATTPDHRFNSREAAENFMAGAFKSYSGKIAIVQVIEVFESKLTLQPTTL